MILSNQSLFLSCRTCQKENSVENKFLVTVEILKKQLTAEVVKRERTYIFPVYGSLKIQQSWAAIKA